MKMTFSCRMKLEKFVGGIVKYGSKKGCRQHFARSGLLFKGKTTTMQTNWEALAPFSLVHLIHQWIAPSGSKAMQFSYLVPVLTPCSSAAHIHMVWKCWAASSTGSLLPDWIRAGPREAGSRREVAARPRHCIRDSWKWAWLQCSVQKQGKIYFSLLVFPSKNIIVFFLFFSFWLIGSSEICDTTLQTACVVLGILYSHG